MKTLIASVGLDGKNRPADVMLVQELLNLNNMTYMPVTGRIGDPMHDQTIAGILAFQRSFMPKPDGSVDPNGTTFKRLNQFAVKFSPLGKTFEQRLDALIQDANERFGVLLTKGDPGRTAEWAQKAHVAHMIKYNSFANTKPQHYQVVSGRNLMKWSFLSDPKTVWDGERWEDFLRTSTGQQCKKSADGNSWQIGFAPDEVQTRKRALNILEESGVATADNRPTEPRSAMVAPGYQGCRSPCLCGGNRSKHIAGQANDMKPKEAMKLVLPNKFVPPGADSFNKYLARFGLKRPMASESWHVEPTS